MCSAVLYVLISLNNGERCNFSTLGRQNGQFMHGAGDGKLSESEAATRWVDEPEEDLLKTYGTTAAGKK